MPAVKKVTKEDIIKASINIIRDSGIEKLSTRNIASKLNCSTQPIFYYYSNMEELKIDVLKEISNIFDASMLKSNYDRPVYKDIGKNYIAFAREEPVLFNILFSSTINDEVLGFVDLNGTSEFIAEVISKQTGLTKEQAKNFHLKMWLFVNGIASLVANNTFNFSDEEIDNLLSEQYLSMILLEIKKGNVKKDLIDFYMNNKLKTKNCDNNE